MACICPTVLANDSHGFREQLERVMPFAERIQIDVMDGIFAPSKSLPLDQIWLPEHITTDIHIMYQKPQNYLEILKKLKPNMVIVHAESNCDITKFAAELRQLGIKTGVAILQSTKVSDIAYLLPHVQHLLIFSGDLGHFGGIADLGLAQKGVEAKEIAKTIEIGWDGGANLANCGQLATAGIDVINVGSAIQKAEDPQTTYATMKSIINPI